MASVAQNVSGENPQRAPRNNNNTEFKRGRQDMMRFSCAKAAYEYTSNVRSRRNNGA